MKKTKVYFLIFILGLFAFIVSSGDLLNREIFTLSNKSIPFPLASEIIDQKKDIRIGLERIVKEKYYITYSKAEGNQSYLGTYLIVENLKQKKVDKNGFKGIVMIDNLGNKYLPLPYKEISDFPQDDPLGWKIIIFNKFPPVHSKASFLTITLHFNDETFILEKVMLP